MKCGYLFTYEQSLVQQDWNLWTLMCLYTYNSLRLTHHGRNFQYAICKCIFLKKRLNFSNTIWLTFVLKGTIDSNAALIQKMAWRSWYQSVVLQCRWLQISSRSGKLCLMTATEPADSDVYECLLAPNPFFRLSIIFKCMQYNLHMQI